LLLPACFALSALVAACIGSGTPAAPAASVGSLASAAAPTSAAPSIASASAAPSSAAPAATAEPTATPEPTPEAVETPSEGPSGSANASAGAGTVEGCTGTDDNRTFFANAATRFSWPVYCAVLPARWFVEVGSFKSGKLDISYKGPSGARFELHEGAVCAAGVDCTPSGTDGGTVPFGDRTATLIHVDDGSLAAVVDRGASTSWLAIGTGLDDAAFRTITTALIRLD
jgi:hypothetical protein